MLVKMAREVAHAKREVLHMDSNDTPTQILNALEQIQASPELQAEAHTDPESVLNKLRLSGTARHAVALGIAGMLVVPGLVFPQSFWA